MITYGSLTLMNRFDLSLVFALFLRNLIHHRFINSKLINIAIFHVLMFNISIIGLKLPLNFIHFFLDLYFIFSFYNCFQFLSHVPWIFALKKLFINFLRNGHFVLKVVVGIICLLVNTPICGYELLLINFNFCWIFRISSTEFSRITVQIIVKHAKIHSLVILILRQILCSIKIFLRNFFSNLFKFKESLFCFLNTFILISL